MLENRLGLRGGDAWVVFSVHEKNRTGNVFSILGRIVGKSWKTKLPGAPEDDEARRWKTWNSHRAKAILHCRKEAVERAFEHQGIGLHIQMGHGARNSRAAHRLAVKNQGMRGPVRARINDGGRNILGLCVADGRDGATGAIAATEIDEERSIAEVMERPGFLEERRLARSIAVE